MPQHLSLEHSSFHLRYVCGMMGQYKGSDILMMVGMAIRKEDKKPVFLGAAAVFAATYISLMVKFFKVFTEKE